MNPYISIVVPIYKVERYIHRCIESLLNQNLCIEMYEILLIDDGSPDNCGMICDQYEEQNENIKVFHKKNGGLSDARNYGVDKSRGKYIMFVDSDDYILNNVLKDIYMSCLEQNEPDVMFLQAEKVYKDGKTKKYDEIMNLSILQKNNKNEILNYISNRKMFPTSAWSKIVKRNILQDIKFKKGQLSEDYEWSMMVYLKAKKFGAYNGQCYYYIQNREGSITSHVSEKHFIDLLKIIESMEREIEFHIQEKEFILSCMAYVYAIMLINSEKYFDKYSEKIVSKKYLLIMRKTKKIRLLNFLCSFFGIRSVVKIVNIYRRIIY